MIKRAENQGLRSNRSSISLQQSYACGFTGRPGSVIPNRHLYFADMGAVCSISQDDGELLAAQETGIIRISRDQTAGPFMSDFSSWGPTSDLKIKPEITAHGGEITSAVANGWDEYSGTSMAAPNMAGAMSLILSYVRKNVAYDSSKTYTDDVAVSNFLVMSTATIANNEYGNPYSPRKQGAGLKSEGGRAIRKTDVSAGELCHMFAIPVRKMGSLADRVGPLFDFHRLKKGLPQAGKRILRLFRVGEPFKFMFR